jgi:hypothetical protein
MCKNINCGKKCPKTTAWWLKMSKSYRMMVKNGQKLRHDGQKCPKITACSEGL